MHPSTSKKRWDFPRNLTSVKLMVQLGVSHGLGVDVCLENTQILESELDSTTALISASQELQVIKNIVKHLSDVPNLGIECGKMYHFTVFGALGLALACNPNIYSGRDLFMRYSQLTFALTDFEVEFDGPNILITIDDTDLDDDVRTFIVERDLSAVITVQRDLFSTRAKLTHIQFAYDVPDNAQAYHEFFHVKPEFGAKNNQVHFELWEPLDTIDNGNNLALVAAEEQCRTVLERYQTQQGLAANVKSLIIRHISGPPDMQMVAKALCVSPRTLRRHLKNENTTFVKLREEVRAELAKEFLLQHTLSVEQITEKLGYAEATCFINAFKRWTGATPLEFRKNHTRT